jgi:hypothetical protein
MTLFHSSSSASLRHAALQHTTTLQTILILLFKPFIVFKTNTASCGGLSGVSDTLPGALQSLDYAFQVASASVSRALFHIGGQTAFYDVNILCF